MTMIERDLDNAVERTRGSLAHGAVLTALSVLIGVYLIATTVLISRDGVFYINQAQKAGYDAWGVAQRYPPAYPLLLLAAHGLLRSFTGDDTTTAWVLSSQIVTLACKTLALIVLFLVGKRLIGGRRSFLAVLILCFLPYAAQEGSDVLREWPLVLVIAAGLWLLLWAVAEHKWWPFGLAGLLAGAGYWLHATCVQLALYGLLSVPFLPRPTCSKLRRAGTVLTVTAGFIFAAAPLMFITGHLLPQQLQHELSGRPPVILSVAGRSASPDPIQVTIPEGQDLRVPIEVLEADVDSLKLSGVLTPAGSRPVYGFHCPANGAYFWTLSERERDLILTDYDGAAWVYDGITCYAYPRAEDAPLLRPLYRLWSAAQSRHFYTMDKSQRDAMVASSAGEQWTDEGVAFYVPAEGTRPEDAVPIHRLRSGEREYSWYAFRGQPLPAGAGFSRGTLQWRPEPGQAGQYQISLIVGERPLDSCQLIQIDVQKAGTASIAPAPTNAPPPTAATRPPSRGHDSLALRSAMALNRIFAGVTENLMVFFAVPLIVGFAHRWRHGASRHERLLITTLLATNVALMFARYVWIEPTSLRRYSLPLVALTIFYIPVGLELMAQWLARRWGRSERVWLYVLMGTGIALCLPKLVQPLGAGKEDYRSLAQWLRENTPAGATVAVPDQRIAFYAGRRGLVYQRQPDRRDVDYIIGTMREDGRGGLPSDWQKVYTPPEQKHGGRQFAIYSKPAGRRGP